MKNFLVLVLGILVSQSAAAYQDGTYTCKNIDGVPANTFKIETINMSSGVDVPHLTITRHYKDKDGKIQTSVNRGFAMHSQVTIDDEPGELLTLGALSLEFSGNNFNNCKKP